METLCYWFLLFLSYSFLGWVCETVYCSVGSRRFVNRGFLTGPLCPVYGFGALLVLWLLRPVQMHVLPLFLSGMVVTTVLEYLTSVLLEKLFHMKWWDYSRYRFQINGRVCLLNSLMFGALSVLLVLFINPFVEHAVASLPKTWLILLAWILLAVLIWDTVSTVRTLLIVKGKMEQLYQLRTELHEKAESARVELGQNLEETIERLRAAAGEVRQNADEERAQLRERLEQLVQKLRDTERLDTLSRMNSRRLLAAFPKLRSEKYEAAFAQLREKWTKIGKKGA